MNFNFYWADQAEELELTALPSPSSAPVLRLEIQQQEWGCAVAFLEIPKNETIEGKYLLILDGSRVLFRGQKINTRYSETQYTRRIEVQGICEKVNEKLAAIIAGEDICPLIFGHDPHHHLFEDQAQVLYFDSKNGAVQKSDLFKGRKHIDLSDFILNESLKINILSPPLDAIDIYLEANWVHSQSGEIDIGPFIARYFRNGIINTYTPQTILKGWPSVGARVLMKGGDNAFGSSGYRVVESYVKEIMPPKTGVLNLYPTYSKFFKYRDGEDVKIHSLARQWFYGKLVLEWHFAQKRREILHLNVRQKTLLPSYGKRKQIYLKLNELAPVMSEKSRFFGSAISQKVIDCALGIAVAHLAKSARCIDVSFEVPFECLHIIDLDTSVTIRHAHFPGGRIEGKITAYKFIQDGFEQKCRIWIQSGCGVGSVELPSLSAEPMYCNGYFNVPSYYTRHESGLCKGKLNVSQVDHLENIGTFGVRDFIESILIRHPPEEQIEALQRLCPVERPIDVLNSHATSIEIIMRDLQTCALYERRLTLDIHGVWTAPQQYFSDVSCA